MEDGMGWANCGCLADFVGGGDADSEGPFKLEDLEITQDGKLR
jgi:hypothetical protein